MALVCDTGPLLAALDRDDPDHVACANLLSTATEDLIVPGLVLQRR
jgi:predicted nucleic acid-binding protein